MNIPNFWYGSCSDGPLSEIYTLCSGKNSDMAKFCPFRTKIVPFFGQNWLFWEFLTYNFQTQLWIFLIFGMELFGILTLSWEPIILCLATFHFILSCKIWFAMTWYRSICLENSCSWVNPLNHLKTIGNNRTSLTIDF